MTTPAPGPRQFEWPAEVPWSQLGPEFTAAWGRPDGQFEPEHVEITGQTGSGKTYLLVALLQDRARLRGSAEVLVATKQADKTFALLGWPVVEDVKGVDRWEQVIFWPRTTLKGGERRAYHAQKIGELLDRLWQPAANVVVAFDEIGYVEELSPRIRSDVRMYWREGRSNGITVAAMKQRPIGVVRDQHSETRWKFVFPPADDDDMRRFSQLLGPPREWAPVLESLDQERHQFCIRNNVTREAYISWIDYPLHPVAAQARQDDRTAGQYLHGRRRRAA